MAQPEAVMFMNAQFSRGIAMTVSSISDRAVRNSNVIDRELQHRLWSGFSMSVGAVYVQCGFVRYAVLYSIQSRLNLSRQTIRFGRLTFVRARHPLRRLVVCERLVCREVFALTSKLRSDMNGKH